MEMVVAVAILGMTLGALYQATSGATRSVALDEKMAYAVELARSLRDAHAVVPYAGTKPTGGSPGESTPNRSCPTATVRCPMAPCSISRWW